MTTYTVTATVTLTTGRAARTTLSLTSHTTPGPALRRMRRHLRATLGPSGSDPGIRAWLDDPSNYAAALQRLGSGRPVQVVRHQGGRRTVLTAYRTRPPCSRPTRPVHEADDR